MNERYIDKMVNVIWRGKRQYYRNIKKGIILEGGDKELVKDALIYELMLNNLIDDKEQFLGMNPVMFRSKVKKSDGIGQDKVKVSDKCLYHYAYRGEFLEEYYTPEGLDVARIENEVKAGSKNINLSEVVNTIHMDKNINFSELRNDSELLNMFEGAQSIDVSDEDKIIFVTLEYKDWGYNIPNMGFRHDAYRYSPQNWIDDKKAIDATLKQVKEIENTNNAPEEINVESFLMWLGNDLNGVYAINYIKLYNRISFGSARWHQQAEQRIRDANLFDELNEYKIIIIEKKIDPISDIGAIAVTSDFKYYMGYDYENDRDIYDLYNERYVPWED